MALLRRHFPSPGVCYLGLHRQGLTTMLLLLPVSGLAPWAIRLVFRHASPFYTRSRRVKKRLTKSNHPQFAQELLSTFSTSIGEVALVPATGGIFTVSILYSSSTSADAERSQTGGGDIAGPLQETVLWDRKRDGGFPGLFALP
jgi:predicted Rdx family selenoprotein